MSALVCGLDVHKRYTYATILGPDGSILAQGKMGNGEVPGFLSQYPVEHVAMEATTSIAPLYRRLAGEGYEVHVAHPKETRTIARARIKTDRTSSRALAELLRVNCLPESYWPPPEVALLREKVRRRAFLVRQQAKLKVKIRSFLTYEGLEPPGYGLFTRRGVEWLEGLGLEPMDCQPQADASAEGGDQTAQPDAPADGGWRRGRSAAGDHPRRLPSLRAATATSSMTIIQSRTCVNTFLKPLSLKQPKPTSSSLAFTLSTLALPKQYRRLSSAEPPLVLKNRSTRRTGSPLA